MMLKPRLPGLRLASRQTALASRKGLNKPLLTQSCHIFTAFKNRALVELYVQFWYLLYMAVNKTHLSMV